MSASATSDNKKKLLIFILWVKRRRGSLHPLSGEREKEAGRNS